MFMDKGDAKKKKKKNTYTANEIVRMESLKLFWGIFFLKVALGVSLLYFDEAFKASTCPTLELTSMNSWHLICCNSLISLWAQWDCSQIGAFKKNLKVALLVN
jgi:hypothetical protein